VAIYSQPRKRLPGAWERNSLLRTELGTFAAISTNGDELPTDTTRTEMKEGRSARANEEGLRTCWPVSAGCWKTTPVSSRVWVRVLYKLPAGSISKTYPTQNLPGLVFRFEIHCKYPICKVLVFWKPIPHWYPTEDLSFIHGLVIFHPFYFLYPSTFIHLRFHFILIPKTLNQKSLFHLSFWALHSTMLLYLLLGRIVTFSSNDHL
jgi:hypothetical protein